MTMSRLTLDQFLAIEETEPASEFLDGEVIQKPMPTSGHALIQMFFGVILFQYLIRSRLGKAGPEWRCVFGPAGRERTFVPDLIYVANDRLRSGATNPDGPLRGAPDLAIEIVSPDQSASLLADKVEFYMANGVRLTWVIDARRGTVSVYAPAAQPRILAAGDMLDGGDVLPGFAVSVSDILAQTDTGPLISDNGQTTDTGKEHE